MVSAPIPRLHPSLPSNPSGVKGKSLIYMSFLRPSSGHLSPLTGGLPVESPEMAQKRRAGGFFARRPWMLRRERD